MAAESSHTDSLVEGQPAKHEGAGDAEHGGASVELMPEKTLVLWTWITFAAVLVVLYKFAWKPILRGLEQREENIRKSIEEAEEISRRLAEIKATQDSMIAEADEKAKNIVAESRKAAVEAARVIEGKAREESQILLENAQREIGALEEKAKVALRRDSAELAVSLAGKILGEQLDAARQRALTDKLIKEL